MREINSEDVEKAQAMLSAKIDDCMRNLVLYSLGEMLPDLRERTFKELGQLRFTQQVIGEYYGS